MRISINESYFHGRGGPTERSVETVLRMLKESGFEAADMSLKNLNGAGKGDAHTAYINNLREYCDKTGIIINQTHAPFFEGRPMPEGYVERLLQCVDNSAGLGAACMVVHADTWYEEKYVQWDYQKVLDTVYEVYAPVVDRAEKRGIRIAMETLHEWLGNIYHRMRLCTFVEELDDIISRFKSDNVGVCWDFGHANMVYKADQFKAMKRLQSRIIATHIHDNIAKFDNHNLPYQGNINWAEGMKTLAELGYEGDLTMEVGYGAVPDPLALDFMRYAHNAGEYLRQQFDAYKKELA